jgi:hypothetical protein
MPELERELLTRHKASPQFLFYGDPSNSGELADDHGYEAVDAAYAVLLRGGLVECQGLVSIGGRPCSTFKLTERGRDAQGLRPRLS